MLCNDNAMTQIICITIVFLFGGPDPAQLNTVNVLYIYYNETQNTNAIQCV